MLFIGCDKEEYPERKAAEPLGLEICKTGVHDSLPDEASEHR
jgi:hypothetical protein